MAFSVIKQIVSKSSQDSKQRPSSPVLSAQGRSLNATQLNQWSNELARNLLRSSKSRREQPIGVLAPPGLSYAAAMLAVWKTGGVATPLQPCHAQGDLEYILEDTGMTDILVHESCADLATRLISSQEKNSHTPQIHLHAVSSFPKDNAAAGPNPEQNSNPHAIVNSSMNTSAEPGDAAMIIYTSGTTNRPKGVVSTYASLDAQIQTLIKAWGWSESDRTLNILPLHHIHGIVNVLCCALACGAHCEFLEKFDAEGVWRRLASGEITVFMAVPTIYVKLIQHFQNQDVTLQKSWSAAARKLRLMVSGSAALPRPVFDTWEEITGHRLLERYGMTETGMILSNPYLGERVKGSVGFPLPGVQVELRNESGAVILETGVAGEVVLKSTCLFREYWRKPDATREAFSADGWFRTGDVAERDAKGYHYILGRSSQDIIKSGGYKISALEIESRILEYPDIIEAAVVGMPDDIWGEVVAVACVLRGQKILDSKACTEFLHSRLSSYKIPKLWQQLPELPKNAMGKTIKAKVREIFQKSV